METDAVKTGDRASPRDELRRELANGRNGSRHRGGMTWVQA